jgi:maleylacetoacetate isomerase
MQLVLWQYWRSSSSWRVRFALAHKGLAYESRVVDLLGDAQTSDDHLARSPMGTVPCLVIDGRPLTESVAIVEHLDAIAPERPLLPSDPWARARVRQLAEIVNSGIQPLHNLAVIRRVSSDPAEQKAWAKHWIERGLGAFESLLATIEHELGEHRYAVGDELSMADVFLVPQIYQARRFGAELAKVPRTMALHDRVAALEAAAASSPERSPGAPASK